MFDGMVILATKLVLVIFVAVAVHGVLAPSRLPMAVIVMAGVLLNTFLKLTVCLYVDPRVYTPVGAV